MRTSFRIAAVPQSKPAWVQGLLVLLMLTGAAQTATAEDQKPDPAAQSGWQFNVVGFAWLPSVTGSVTVRGHEAQDNASFTDIVEKSDSILAFMSHVEAQKDRFGLFVEPIWMRLGFGSKADALISNLTTEITYVEFGGFYRALEGVAGPANRHWFIDALAGGRYTNLSVSASLNDGSSPSQSKSWVDPFIGARVRLEMTPTWDFQLRGDIGGFGAGSQFSWNLVALIGHRFPLFGTSAEAIVGFKALDQDYQTGSGNRACRWNNILWGPVLGLSATF
jgi:hypothetical protein